MTRGRATDHQRAHVSRHENVACLETNACTHTHTHKHARRETYKTVLAKSVKLRQITSNETCGLNTVIYASSVQIY